MEEILPFERMSSLATYFLFWIPGQKLIHCPHGEIIIILRKVRLKPIGGKEKCSKGGFTYHYQF